MNWYLEVLKKYAVFTGRARRKEYWMFVLFNWLISLALTFVDSLVFGYAWDGSQGIAILNTVYSLAVLIPSLAVGIRRLHDTDRSGWWLLINLIPILGWIWFLVLMCLDGTHGSNRFGVNPKNPDADEGDVWPDVA
ncbi:MAG: DUF805 domain-containing protein [Planctomycetes bacterium]|nr:DUF805 domain-containing protein [Planctomycetota bacterium]